MLAVCVPGAPLLCPTAWPDAQAPSVSLLTIATSRWVQEGLEEGARTPVRKARAHLKMPRSECNNERSDFGDGSCWDSFLESEEEDRKEQEEETEVECPLVDEGAHPPPGRAHALLLGGRTPSSRECVCQAHFC